jgi:hypothetical protein
MGRTGNSKSILSVPARAIDEGSGPGGGPPKMVSPSHGQGSRHRCFGPGVIAGRGLHSSLVAWCNRNLRGRWKTTSSTGYGRDGVPALPSVVCSHRTYGPRPKPRSQPPYGQVRSIRFYHRRRRRRLRGGTGRLRTKAGARSRAAGPRTRVGIAPTTSGVDEVTAIYATPAPPCGGLETVGLPRRRGMVGADIPARGSFDRRSNRVQAPPTAKAD